MLRGRPSSRPSERSIDTLQPRNSPGAILLFVSVLGDCAGCPSVSLCASSGGGLLIWYSRSAADGGSLHFHHSPHLFVYLFFNKNDSFNSTDSMLLWPFTIKKKKTCLAITALRPRPHTTLHPSADKSIQLCGTQRLGFSCRVGLGVGGAAGTLWKLLLCLSAAHISDKSKQLPHLSYTPLPRKPPPTHPPFPLHKPT